MHSTVNSMLIYNTFSIAPEYRQSQYEMCLQTTLCKAQFCFSFIFSKMTHYYITANMLCSIYFFSQIKLYIWLHGGKRKGHFYILYILRKVKCRSLYYVNKKGFPYWFFTGVLRIFWISLIGVFGSKEMSINLAVPFFSTDIFQTVMNSFWRHRTLTLWFWINTYTITQCYSINYSRGRKRRSWSADVLQSLAPTLNKPHLPVALVILKTLN